MIKIFTGIVASILMVIAAQAGEPAKILKSQIGASFDADVTAYAKEFSDWKAHMDMVVADKAAGVPKEKAHAPFPPPTAPAPIAAAVDENGKPNYQIVDDGPTPEQTLASKKAVLIQEVDRAEAAEIDKTMPATKLRAMQFRYMDVKNFDASTLQKSMEVVDAERKKVMDLNLQHASKLQKSMEVVDAERKKLADLNHQRETLALKIAASKSIVSSVVQVITGPSSQSIADATAAASLDKQVSDEAQVLKQAEDSYAAIASDATFDKQISDQAQIVKQAQDSYADQDGLAARTRSPNDHAFALDYEKRQKTVDSIHRWAAQAISDVADLTVVTVDSWKLTPFVQN
jgi:hypothetical protein